MPRLQDIIARYTKLKATRDGYWQSLWRKVRHYCYPDEEEGLSQGGERGNTIYDITAIEARQRLASGMYQWMAPPDQRWFELLPQDKALRDNATVKEFFQAASGILAYQLANSNWPSELIKTLNDLACGLDGVLYCEDGGLKSSLNFKSFPIETVCYECDRYGCVDTVFREMTLSARQALQQFGQNALPERMLKAAQDECHQDDEFKILHAVMPRDSGRDGEARKDRKPYASYYIDLQDKAMLEEGGYDEMPFAICSFRKSNREHYGRGPGVDALPDIRMLNRMRQTYILNAEFAANPIWTVPDGSVVGREFNRSPGAVIPYKLEYNGAKPEIIQRGNNLAVDANTIEQERMHIRQQFFWDIFDPLGDLRNMTAAEVSVRNNSKIVPFAPIAGTLHSDLFGRIIQRCLGICARRGLLPVPPPQLVATGGEYRIEFVSKIARSIKRMEALGWLQTETSIHGIIQVRPDIMDNFDADQIARDIAITEGCNPQWLVAAKDRDALREARAQAAAVQQQQQMVQGLAANAAGLSRRPEQGSLMGKVMDSLGAMG